MAEEKVVSINGGDMPTRESSEELTKTIRHLLEMAEAGEIVGFAGVVMFADEGTQRIIVGTAHPGQLGALQLVVHHMASLLLDA